MTLSFCAFALLGILGFADSFATSVALSDSELIVRTNFRRQAIPRTSIVEATWARGAPAMVRLTDGRWLSLPSVGGGNQSIAMALRAWIKSGDVA
jgi:hypothetical protein